MILGVRTDAGEKGVGKMRGKVLNRTAEEDMRCRQSNGAYEEKVFAQYPLIGSRIIPKETITKLNKNVCNYIDKVLKNPDLELPLRAQMQISIVVINYAKDWDGQESGKFWEYILHQLGYRDSSGSVEEILRKSLENAMKRNGRLFLEDKKGREFKATAVVHALAPRKSWMILFDLLFDFYKNNLNWQYIKGDPLVEVMVHALVQKLKKENDEDIAITISSKAYLFQEGVRKLILSRPGYAQTLFERVLLKMDALVNWRELPVSTYEEKLCEEWFEKKVNSVSGSKERKRSKKLKDREVAIDYSHICLRYILIEEKEVRLALPDIRLKNKDMKSALLEIDYGGEIVYREPMEWYGNELGKTLKGKMVSLPSLVGCNRRIPLHVTIRCDQEVIFDSQNKLEREVLFFRDGVELGRDAIQQGNYTLVVSENACVDMENARAMDMEPLRNTGFKAMFLELDRGYILTEDGHVLLYDDQNCDEIRVISPKESEKLPKVTEDDKEYCFAYLGSACSVVVDQNALSRYRLVKNEEIIDISRLCPTENEQIKEFVFDDNEKKCSLKLVDLQSEKAVFQKNYIVITSAECQFDKKIYFDEAGYDNAEFYIKIDDYCERISFTAQQNEIRLPYENGELHMDIPRISIRENTEKWLWSLSGAWYIDDVPRESFLTVMGPEKMRVRYTLNDPDGRKEIYEGNDEFGIGNVLHSNSDKGIQRFLEVRMEIEYGGEKSGYELARIYYREQFLREIKFWTEGEKLYWNQGGGFIGKNDREFYLEIYDDKENIAEYRLNENTSYLEIPPKMKIGEYRYEISILSRSVFAAKRITLSQGSMFVGDENILRFMNRRIVIDTITDEFNETAGHISIRTCYIDQIKFQGIKETSEGDCPVYTGILYQEDHRGRRHDFSFDTYENEKGRKKMMVNPVQIIYLGEHSLCIADSDGDGLYYYYYYDRDRQERVYALTDQEYTERNSDKYATADLYLYNTERI